MVIRKCSRCKKEFKSYQREIDRGRGKYCSKICKEPKPIKKCLICKDEFRTKLSDYERRKTCSKKCYALLAKGRPSPLKGKHIGKGSYTSFQKNDPRLIGKNNPNWKDDKVGYMALHSRNIRLWGRINFCEGCGTEEFTIYDWANISGEYKHNREDWLRLCRPCHRVFDKVGYKNRDVISVRTIFHL